MYGGGVLIPSIGQATAPGNRAFFRVASHENVVENIPTSTTDSTEPEEWMCSKNTGQIGYPTHIEVCHSEY